MATIAPIAFSLGGRVGGDNPDQTIASVATISYTAFLVGPVVIGFLASVSSLQVAMVTIVALSLVIVLLAGTASKEAIPA